MKKRKSEKGYVYKRGNSRFLWIAYYDINGVRRPESSGSEDEKVAQKMLEMFQRKVRAQKAMGVVDLGPLTFRRYAKSWLDNRRSHGVRSVDKDEDCIDHWLRSPVADLLLEDVRRSHVKDWVQKLQNEKGPDGGLRFAPRSIHHIYAAARVMYNDAIADELVTISPCTLKVRRGELPKKADKNPVWRGSAIFSLDEAESLISDERIPEYRRVLWAMLFMTAARVNEATPRRWRDWNPRAEPLGSMRIDSHWDVKLHHVVPGRKTGPGNDVPVHPTLAKILAAWKLTGWERFRGRPPTPDDLIIPSPYNRGKLNEDGTRNEVLNSNSTLERLHEDLTLLGLPARRQHDTRRTFISLSRAAPGTIDAVLKAITHGPPAGTILDDYTTFPWPVLCEQMLKLKIQAREGKLLALPGCYTTGTASGGGRK